MVHISSRWILAEIAFTSKPKPKPKPDFSDISRFGTKQVIQDLPDAAASAVCCLGHLITELSQQTRAHTHRNGAVEFGRVGNPPWIISMHVARLA